MSLRKDSDDELHVQCDVFEEELTADTEAQEELREETRVNIADPQALFTAIHHRVYIINISVFRYLVDNWSVSNSINW